MKRFKPQVAHFDEYLKKEVDRLEEQFDNQFEESRDEWWHVDLDHQTEKMTVGVLELAEAIGLYQAGGKTGVLFNIEEEVRRIEQMRIEWLNTAQYGLQGADWCTRKIEELRKRLK